MIARALIAAMLLAFAAPATAREHVSVFDVHLEVQGNGDLIVTERIAVNAEGEQIRHGIYRDLPPGSGADGYELLDVERDGRSEPYEVIDNSGGWRIRIGAPDVRLEWGAHDYTMRYRILDRIRRLNGVDELNWNITGAWPFPIEQVRVRVSLPPGALVVGGAAYIVGPGDFDADYEYSADGDEHIFETTRELQSGEAVIVSLEFEQRLRPALFE